MALVALGLSTRVPNGDEGRNRTGIDHRSDRDDGGVLMDIEADIECNCFHGVVVSSCSLDESERIPRP